MSLNDSVCIAIRCQMIFVKIHELEILGTRQRILQKKMRIVAVLESIQSRFEFAIYLSVMSFPRTSEFHCEF